MNERIFSNVKIFIYIILLLGPVIFSQQIINFSNNSLGSGLLLVANLFIALLVSSLNYSSLKRLMNKSIYKKRHQEIQNNYADLKAQFDKNYYESIEPILIQKEKEKRKILKSQITLVILLLPILLLIIGSLKFFIKDALSISIMIHFFIICYIILFASSFISFKYEKQVKETIMHHLMKGLNWKWSPSGTISVDKAIDSLLFFDFDTDNVNDCFEGKFKDVSLVLSELHHALKGGQNRLLISLSFNKNFSGKTIIKSAELFKSFIIPEKFKEVLLENVEFDDSFSIYSTNQIEARYLLTPAFMERFQNLESSFNISKLECSFFDNQILIALHSGKDFFKIPISLITSLHDKKIFDKIAEEIISIIAIVDILKLDQNIGM